jgi:hypothetical protein
VGRSRPAGSATIRPPTAPGGEPGLTTPATGAFAGEGCQDTAEGGGPPESGAARPRRGGRDAEEAGTPPTPRSGSLAGRIDGLAARLERIEAALSSLVEQRVPRGWYSTAEAARVLGRAEFTVREWCRLGRVHAEKRRCGRGRSREWMIAHAELLRIQDEGLLPSEH